MGTQIKSDGGCFGGEAGENRWYKINEGGGGYCYKKYGGGYLVFKIYHAVIESMDVGIGCATQCVLVPTSFLMHFGWVGSRFFGFSNNC